MRWLCPLFVLVCTFALVGCGTPTVAPSTKAQIRDQAPQQASAPTVADNQNQE